ncbi:protein of unknown function [Brevefilum fermentans]|uniref:Uncharacterized protein n=1 Tax=Candidatus Brevifilum fermentans TaxID=1986204 RepID=A0A1Y6K2T5_9CHLR|nr:protein of unknown function [Brevefilum fermentans]
MNITHDSRTDDTNSIFTHINLLHIMQLDFLMRNKSIVTWTVLGVNTK